MTAAAMAKYEDVKARSTLGLAYAVKQRFKMILDIELQPVLVIIPENGVFTKSVFPCSVLSFWGVFLFVADKFTGELIDSNEGVLKWIPNEELTKINLWEGDKYFIPWLFGDKFFSAKFLYQKGEYLNHEVNFY